MVCKCEVTSYPPPPKNLRKKTTGTEVRKNGFPHTLGDEILSVFQVGTASLRVSSHNTAVHHRELGSIAVF